MFVPIIDLCMSRTQVKSPMSCHLYIRWGVEWPLGCWYLWKTAASTCIINILHCGQYNKFTLHCSQCNIYLYIVLQSMHCKFNTLHGYDGAVCYMQNIALMAPLSFPRTVAHTVLNITWLTYIVNVSYLLTCV